MCGLHAWRTTITMTELMPRSLAGWMVGKGHTSATAAWLALYPTLCKHIRSSATTRFSHFWYGSSPEEAEDMHLIDHRTEPF